MKRNTRSQSGFTVVEILIVLAIAGIMLMIVFLAIPQLTRTARNNQRRQDVNLILQAVSRWELNNSGSMPSPGSNFLQADISKMTYYDTTSIHYPASADTPSCGSGSVSSGINVFCFQNAKDAADTYGSFPSSGTSNVDQVIIANYSKCDPSPSHQGEATNAGSGYNDVVALYAVESGPSSTTEQCQQL